MLFPANVALLPIILPYNLRAVKLSQWTLCHLLICYAHYLSSEISLHRNEHHKGGVLVVWITPLAALGSAYILTSHTVNECIQLLLLELTSALQNPPENWWFFLFCEYISFMYSFPFAVKPDLLHPRGLSSSFAKPGSGWLFLVSKFSLTHTKISSLLSRTSYPSSILFPLALTYHMALNYWPVSVKSRYFVCLFFMFTFVQQCLAYSLCSRVISWEDEQKEPFFSSLKIPRWMSPTL